MESNVTKIEIFATTHGLQIDKLKVSTPVLQRKIEYLKEIHSKIGVLRNNKSKNEKDAELLRQLQAIFRELKAELVAIKNHNINVLNNHKQKKQNELIMEAFIL